MKKVRVLHLATHLNVGGITTYIQLLASAMNGPDFELMVLSSGGACALQFEKLGIRTFSLPIKTKSELDPRIYFFIPKVIQIIREQKIDLLHAHTRVTQVMAWWIRRFTGIPYVSTCHGFYKRRLGRWLLPAWGNRVIAISVPVEDSLIQDFKVPESRARTIFNAVNIEELEARAQKHDLSKVLAEWNLKPEFIRIGIVARLVEDKGHEYLIRALRVLLDQKTFDAKLLIVGEGPHKAKLFKLVKELRLESNVVFIGNLIDVTKALVAIDIFVLPAVWREGFGLSIIEAMALHKPVIVTNIWALNALVHNMQNGLLIEPKSVNQLADGINLLIKDKKLSQRIGEEGYQTVKKEFSISRMAAQMRVLYQEVLSGKS